MPFEVREVYVIVRAVPSHPDCRALDFGIWIDPLYPLSYALELAQERLDAVIASVQQQGQRHYTTGRKTVGLDCGYTLIVVSGGLGLR